MSGSMPVLIEAGTKGKKVVAYAQHWPGLERNGSRDEVALQKLATYFPRYARVAERAGLGHEFAAQSESDFEVVERYVGSGSTEFWGISFVHSSIDHLPITADELERQLSLLQACWAEFDHFGATVSAELKRGPRGGGRMRDEIVRHLLYCEIDWAKKLDLHYDYHDVIPLDARAAYHEDFVNAVRRLHAEDKPAKSWTLPFLIRHTAFHVMDHAWEMEDKDLSRATA
jgi:hypothetical protein